MTETLRASMRPRARLIKVLGEELISDEPVAVVELVKNAYDADAARVEVRFEGNNSERFDRIVIVDDGHGMDEQAVIAGWMEPGTSSKRKSGRSPKGRNYLGAKGIGRFAAARLAETMLLETKSSPDSDAVLLLLSWGTFDDDAYLDELDFEYEVQPISDLGRGTRITLDKLRRDWSHDDYERLYYRLSRLVSPTGEAADFSITLDIPGKPDLSQEVQPPPLVAAPTYTLRGTLDATGVFVGEISVADRDPEPVQQKLRGVDAKPGCGPFSVEIRAWDRDRSGLEPLAEKLQLSVSEIRKTLNALSGVSIYRDGFRVHPYGEPGNDWLGLDLRSRQNPVKALANNQIIGSIRLDRQSNPGLEERSTREGLVHNLAYYDLTEWILEVLSVLESRRYDARPRQDNALTGDPLFNAFDVRDVVRQAREHLGAEHPVTKILADTEKQLNQGVERVQDVFSRLLLSAGLGHMVDIVIHEIGAPLGKLSRQLSVLERDLSRMLDESLLAVVTPKIGAMKSWLEQIYNLRNRLDPQTPAKRGRAESFDVADEIRDSLQLYESVIQKQKIAVDFKEPSEKVYAKMSRAVLGQILANLIDNSVFWLVRSKGIGNGGRLRVRLRSLEGGFTIVVADDGPGVEETRRDKIFEAYYTTKPNGMGLGLYIARLVIEPYGKLTYSERGRLGGAAFEATFEQRVGR
jgi:signal transduction histidine kinase